MLHPREGIPIQTAECWQMRGPHALRQASHRLHAIATHSGHASGTYLPPDPPSQVSHRQCHAPGSSSALRHRPSTTGSSSSALRSESDSRSDALKMPSTHRELNRGFLGYVSCDGESRIGRAYCRMHLGGNGLPFCLATSSVDILSIRQFQEHR